MPFRVAKRREAKTRRRDETREFKNSTRWRKLRKRILVRDRYLCQTCIADGRTTVATEVDHIQPRHRRPDLLWDASNLQSICHSCHSAKTQREAFGGLTEPIKADGYLDRHPWCVDCTVDGRLAGDEKPANTVCRLAPWLGDELPNLVGCCELHASEYEMRSTRWPDGRGVFVCGLPATGKTTWARSYAAAHKCDLWDMDDVAAMARIQPWQRRSWSSQQVDRLVRMRSLWLVEHAYTAFVCIVARPRSAVQLAREYGGSVHHVQCVESERQARLLERAQAALPQNDY